MSVYLSISADKSTVIQKSLHEILSPEHLLEVARRVGLLKILKEFNAADYLLTAISFCMLSPKEREYRLVRFSQRYNEKHGTSLDPKNIHNQLRKPQMLEFTSEITKEIIALTANTLKVKRSELMSDELGALLEKLGVKDIILIDGVEMTLYPGCIDNFECKGKGRKHTDGTEAKPRLKLHVAFSLCKMIFEYIQVTEACGNEKEQVLPESFHNCLLIMDRGYVADSLENRISNTNGNKFLIKGKRNMAGTVLKAYDVNGRLRPKYTGRKVSQLPKHLHLDLDVKLSNGQVIRVIQHVKTKSRNNTSPVTILRTNIPRKSIDLKQLFLIYRLRWQVELYAKYLKSGNSLQSINSEILSVILSFINISMISSMCKNYFGIMAKLKRGIACLSILKLNCTSFVFAEAMLKFSVVSRNTRTQIFKKLFDFIESNCCRTSPSKRDLRLLKDLPSLIKKIVSMNNIRVVKNA